MSLERNLTSLFFCQKAYLFFLTYFSKISFDGGNHTEEFGFNVSALL
jgi:hypothetical protein